MSSDERKKLSFMMVWGTAVLVGFLSGCLYGVHMIVRGGGSYFPTSLHDASSWVGSLFFVGFAAAFGAAVVAPVGIAVAIPLHRFLSRRGKVSVGACIVAGVVISVFLSAIVIGAEAFFARPPSEDYFFEVISMVAAGIIGSLVFWRTIKP